jgi:hypothetical protein
MGSADAGNDADTLRPDNGVCVVDTMATIATPSRFLAQYHPGSLGGVFVHVIAVRSGFSSLISIVLSPIEHLIGDLDR